MMTYLAILLKTNEVFYCNFIFLQRLHLHFIELLTSIYFIVFFSIVKSGEHNSSDKYITSMQIKILFIPTAYRTKIYYT